MRCGYFFSLTIDRRHSHVSFSTTLVSVSPSYHRRDSDCKYKKTNNNYRNTLRQALCRWEFLRLQDQRVRGIHRQTVVILENRLRGGTRERDLQDGTQCLSLCSHMIPLCCLGMTREVQSHPLVPCNTLEGNGPGKWCENTAVSLFNVGSQDSHIFHFYTANGED